jgi:hypothetical protein
MGGEIQRGRCMCMDGLAPACGLISVNHCGGLKNSGQDSRTRGIFGRTMAEKPRRVHQVSTVASTVAMALSLLASRGLQESGNWTMRIVGG